jgi:hypothetical protein
MAMLHGLNHTTTETGLVNQTLFNFLFIYQATDEFPKRKD